jgi:hypothetical protein
LGCSNTKKFQWNHLPIECQSDVDVVLTAISNSYIQKWEDIHESLQSIDSVAFAAWKSILRWQEEYYTNLTLCCPTLNRDFFISCIEQEKIDDWDDLPQEYRNNLDFARALTLFPSKSVAYSILDEFPDLCQDRETWLKVMRSPSLHNYVGSLLELFAPNGITSDKSLMLYACQFDTVLRSVDVTLSQDISFLCEVLQQHPQQLVYLDRESQRLFPELVPSCLRSFSELNLPSHTIRKLVENLDRTFWNNQSNCRLWFILGFPHPHVLMSRGYILSYFYYDKEEVAILIATHCRREYRNDSFSIATSDRLRSDKSFMSKVVELDPELILCAVDELQTDFDLALMSIGNSRQIYDYYAENKTEFMQVMVDTVRHKLSLYDLYLNVVLAGMVQPQSYLYKLGQGNETTISFKKSIASYLGVPFGRQLHMLRKIESNSE